MGMIPEVQRNNFFFTLDPLHIPSPLPRSSSKATQNRPADILVPCIAWCSLPEVEWKFRHSWSSAVATVSPGCTSCTGGTFHTFGMEDRLKVKYGIPLNSIPACISCTNDDIYTKKKMKTTTLNSILECTETSCMYDTFHPRPKFQNGK